MTSALFESGPADGIERDAAFSEDRAYRWSLSRCWKMSMRPDWCGWIMLNPSMADEREDDPTIRRCMGFARGCGFNGINVCNLFAFRATKPRELLTARHPVCRPHEEENYLRLLLDMHEVCPVIVAAWGADGVYQNRAEMVRDLFRAHGVPLKCLGLTKNGQPLHPLYLHGRTTLIDF